MFPSPTADPSVAKKAASVVEKFSLLILFFKLINSKFVMLDYYTSFLSKILGISYIMLT